MKKMRLYSIGLAIVCVLTACTSQGTGLNGSKTAGQDRTAASAEAQDSAAQGLSDAPAGKQEEAVTGQTDAAVEAQNPVAQGQTAAAAGTQKAAAQDTAAGMSSAAETAGSQIPHSSVHGTYVNEENGWYVQYDPALFTVKEEKDDVTFLYKGEAAGENYVEIRYIPGKEAREALTAELEQLQEDRGVEEDDITRDEWYFFEKTWGYIASAEYSDDGGDVTVLYQAAEYNGGVILTKLLEHMTDESVLEWEMDVALRKIVETLAFYHYDEQTEFSYVPGTYSRTESDGDAVDKIILKKDHTGTIIFQDQIPVYWGSYLLTEKNTGKSYEYTIEGEMLLLNMDDQWIEFEKTENPEEGSSLLDDPDYVKALNREIDTLYKDSTGNVGRIHKMQAFILELALHAKTQNPDFQVIAYLSVGSAEQNRWYCQDDWLWIDPDNKNSYYSMKTGTITDKGNSAVYTPFAAPSSDHADIPVWLVFGFEQDFPEEAYVEYWHKDWRDIIINGGGKYAHKTTGDNTSSLDRIIAQGFDGVYLDCIDDCVDNNAWTAYDAYWNDNGGIPE